MRPRAAVATGLASILLGLLLNVTPVHAAAVTFNLCADEGSVTLPGTALPVPIWGFVQNTGAGCPASGAIPGPQLTVNAGDIVTVNLTNNLLAENVSLVFPGQNLVPDNTGATPGGGKSYSFTASNPGTYLYESGVSPGVQLPMGLYGALVVRPVSAPNTPILNRAYNDISTLFNTQAVLVLSDIDPNLNNSPDPNAFNMVNYNPTYWLINGKAYPDTAPIPVSPGQRLLLRYVNAGSANTSMIMLNLRQRLIALDSFAQASSLQNDIESLTVASGQTADTIVMGPNAPGLYPLYNRQMHITNGMPNLDPPPAPGEDRGVAAPHFPGGMMTFISVPTLLFFSVNGANVIPGVLTPFDDADIYGWSGTGYARFLDATGIGLPSSANIDDLVVTGAQTFYMSFAANGGTSIPALGPDLVQDEDIVKYDHGVWSRFFDGSAVDLTLDPEDVDAFDILSDGSVVVSTVGNASVTGVAASAPQDLMQCVPTSPPGAEITACTWTVYFDGSDVGLTLGTENIDAVAVADGKIYLSTTGVFGVTGVSGEGMDVFTCNAPVTGTNTACGGVPNFSMFFDGSVRGLPVGTNLDGIDRP